MKLPDIAFSQHNLQDFVDCRRRFLLRHVQDLAWPAVVTEPVAESERLMRQGQVFHKLAQEYQLGLPGERLEEIAAANDLSDWWASYRAFAAQLASQPARFYPELTLWGVIGDYRLSARFDLVVVDAECLTIFDWKTSRHRPPRSRLENRLQTRVYPYVLTLAGGGLLGAPTVSPAQVRMVYWYPDFPDQPEIFDYSADQFEADRHYLADLVDAIVQLPENEFFQTSQETLCQVCVFRSLCDRGTRAGGLADYSLEETDDPGAGHDAELGNIQIDFSSVPEIEF